MTSEYDWGSVTHSEIALGDPLYPSLLASITDPPKKLYVLGDPNGLGGGLAVVGARKATPYGISCARRFSFHAAQHGVPIVSGGARGCDAAAHRAALEAGGRTIVVMGGGLHKPYPAQHKALFHQILDSGGALVSEQPWTFDPLPWCFRRRNRIIAGLARATLIVEAGLPSGTFSTADAALSAGRDVLAIPGSITSSFSAGANRLIAQGAVPIVDDETFDSALFSLFGLLRQEDSAGTALSGLQRFKSVANRSQAPQERKAECALLAALDAEPLGIEELNGLAGECGVSDSLTWVMVWLAEAQRDGYIARYPNGRYGPCTTTRS